MWEMNHARIYLSPIALGAAAPVAVVGAIAAAAGWALVRFVPRGRPGALAIAGACVAALAWLADLFVLPRLYPALHGLFFAAVMLAWSATWLAARGRGGSRAAAI